MRRTASALLVILLAIAAPAAAQARRPAQRRPPPADRIFVSVDGIYQAGTKDFNDTATFPLNVETGTFATAYDVKPGPAFNVTGSALVWRRLAVGVGVSRFRHDTPTGVTASIPHPFFFNRPRALSSDVAGLSRQEVAVHVQARTTVPLSKRMSKRMQATVFVGPSFFSVRQDVLNQVGYSETYPYDVVTAAAGQSGTVSTSKVGFNLGADISCFFTKQLGVGGTAQYAGTTVDLTSAGGDSISVKVGGFQVGGGLRLRF